ncbi:Heat shock cognate 70 kDa protein [Zostera marina]|uniref:Heat shock cognate 70 kDa protein n=1 Tax=Zostera marina TaxID=29655 RepID=A0A0K9Q5F9_ZOSMR|nr:Heat shock cognate 70 kDa protein [Zostera marina]
MVEYAIGIDLGTTNSCVAVWRNDQVEVVVNGQGNRTTPSCVAFTHTERLVGDAAQNQCRINPTNTIFGVKRLIGRRFNGPCVQRFVKQSPFKVISGVGHRPTIVVSFKGEEKQFVAEEISSMVLAHMHTLAEKYLGKKVSKAVVTVPAYFNNSQRRATKDAGRIAGLNVMQILSEPMAAAVAYGFDDMISGSDVKKNVLVFDLGGGTFDVSVIHIKGGNMEVKATSGDTFLGGEDFDDRMVSHFVKDIKKKKKIDISCDPRALRRLRSACEKAKRVLSFSEETTIDLDYLCQGIDYQTSVRRGLFEELNMDLFIKCMDTVKKCLADAKLVKESVNEVIVVGGSTRIPKVVEMLQDLFSGIEFCKFINPDEAVAFGAAIQAAKLVDGENKRLQNLVLRDVTPFSLWILSLNGDINVVIPRNTCIPTNMSNVIATTFFDTITEVAIGVGEGERKLTNDNHFLGNTSIPKKISVYFLNVSKKRTEVNFKVYEDINFLGEFTLSDLPKTLGRHLRIITTFELDADGILTLSAVDCDSGSKEIITFRNEEGRLRSEDINRMIEEAERYRIEDGAKARKLVSIFNLESLMINVKYWIFTSNIDSDMKEFMRFGIQNIRKWFDENVDSADTLEFENYKIFLENIWNEFALRYLS